MGMKCGMTIEYLKCRADLNFEVDCDQGGGVLFYPDNGSFSSVIYFFKYTSYAFKM